MWQSPQHFPTRFLLVAKTEWERGDTRELGNFPGSSYHTASVSTVCSAAQTLTTSSWFKAPEASPQPPCGPCSRSGKWKNRALATTWPVPRELLALPYERPAVAGPTRRYLVLSLAQSPPTESQDVSRSPSGHGSWRIRLTVSCHSLPGCPRTRIKQDNIDRKRERERKGRESQGPWGIPVEPDLAEASKSCATVASPPKDTRESKTMERAPPVGSSGHRERCIRSCSRACVHYIELGSYQYWPVLVLRIAPAASGDVKQLVGAVGGSVTFSLNHSVERVGSIVWIFHTTLATLQPGKENNSSTIIVTQTHKRPRMSFSSQDYSLTLSNLERNDSGIYSVEIHSSDRNNPAITKYVLQVYEYLSKPKVTNLLNKKNGTCMTNLTCSVEEGRENVTYTWKSVGHAAREIWNGSILPLSWRQGDTNMTFICTVRNPISSNSSTPVSSWELCEGTAADTVAPMATLYLILMPILLITIMGLVCILNIKRRKEFTKEKKEIESHQETPNTCSSSGLNTLYDTISYPNVSLFSSLPGLSQCEPGNSDGTEFTSSPKGERLAISSCGEYNFWKANYALVPTPP
ncbi:PREDICTED: uncharacterized protein LOC102843045 [Elephantulus edwardii]|uniref:uncharacterized protein LOC102843045 n=1 Tax=Elephantulus edwardii TaxID=28737 RepID=UPI0003F0C056|nr:PREDICTED: uncharacterized protein LOC102843045 [Elephantulus edwardii]